MAASAGQPGRLDRSSTSLSPTKITSGCARTTISGLILGNAPRLAGTMFFKPSCAKVSPIKEDSLAA